LLSSFFNEQLKNGFHFLIFVKKLSVKNNLTFPIFQKKKFFQKIILGILGKKLGVISGDIFALNFFHVMLSPEITPNFFYNF
jgi:hypothetical protein